MSEFLQGFWLPLLVFVLIAALSVFLAVLVLRARRRPAPVEMAVEAAPEEEEILREADAASEIEGGDGEGLKRSFASAMKRLRRQASRRALYDIPWFLVLGASGSKPRDLLTDLGMGLPFGPPDQPLPATGDGCNWWFFDGAVLLEVGEAYLLRDTEAGTDERGWRSLLGLLTRYRPERPVDGVVLTVSCLELLEARRRGAMGMAELERRAGLIYRKLADARRKLGIDFPLYILVTGSEQLPGFRSFCASMPRHTRGEIFGWSSPYSLETSFSDIWVDEAFGAIGERLDKVLLEVFAQGEKAPDSAELFLFPQTLQALRESMRTYLRQVVNA
ncbi:MAG: hypothetical protein KDD47_25635, partial [Acidobacteria bacterium]|nr:hypothetical protein [Acidobacteriota bacterium]